MSKKIFISRLIPQKGIKLLREKFGDSSIEINTEDRALTHQELLERVKGRDAVITLLTDRIDEEVLLNAGEKLKIVSNYAVGYNNIDLEAARKHGVMVTNTPGVLTDATADMAIGLMFAVARRIIEGDLMMRSGQFKGWKPTLLLGSDISGKTLGIIGAGRIGINVAQKMVIGFKMKLLYYDQRNIKEMDDIGGVRVDIENLLKNSDIISIHLSYSASTHHLLNESLLRLMKEEAILINTARGPIIDELALISVLAEGRIRGAGLDVYEDEPLMKPGLKELYNTVLLPHLGSATVSTRDDMAIIAAQNVIDALEDHYPKYLDFLSPGGPFINPKPEMFLDITNVCFSHHLTLYKKVAKSCAIVVDADELTRVENGGESGNLFGYKLLVDKPSEECIRPSSRLGGGDIGCLFLCDRMRNGQPNYDSKLLMARDGFCSAYLVSPNTVITAAHCVAGYTGEVESARDFAFVFDFKTFGPDLHIHLQTETFPNGLLPDHYFVENVDKVYWGKEVVKVEHTNARDYAVIKLDRDVDDGSISYPPVQNPKKDDNTDFFMNVGTDLVNVGHPWAFVELYDDDGKISRCYDEWECAVSVDGEGGSSGSIIANKANGKVLGHVVRGRGLSDMYRMGGGSGENCWLRSNAGNCSIGVDANNNGINDACELVPRIMATTSQYYQYIDPNPVTFPFLSKAVNKDRGSRTKALQKLIEYTTGYSLSDGIWNDAFNTFVIEKMRSTTLINGDPILCRGCLVTDTLSDGTAAIITAVPREVLSIWLPSTCSASSCPSNAILALRELLRNGHEDNTVNIEGNSWTDDISNAIKRFSVHKGYPETEDVSMDLWHHIWRTVTDRSILD